MIPANREGPPTIPTSIASFSLVVSGIAGYALQGSWSSPALRFSQSFPFASGCTPCLSALPPVKAHNNLTPSKISSNSSCSTCQRPWCSPASVSSNAHKPASAHQSHPPWYSSKECAAESHSQQRNTKKQSHRSPFQAHRKKYWKMCNVRMSHG